MQKSARRMQNQHLLLTQSSDHKSLSDRASIEFQTDTNPAQNVKWNRAFTN